MTSQWRLILGWVCGATLWFAVTSPESQAGLLGNDGAPLASSRLLAVSSSLPRSGVESESVVWAPWRDGSDVRKEDPDLGRQRGGTSPRPRGPGVEDFPANLAWVAIDGSAASEWRIVVTRLSAPQEPVFRLLRPPRENDREDRVHMFTS